MNVECVIDKIRYTLSNDNLKVGDEVFPIASGRRLDDGGWILHYLEFDKYHYTNFETGFPKDPHIIEKIAEDNINTNKGYSYPQVYYKIIKKEHQVKTTDRFFARYEWVEIK